MMAIKIMAFLIAIAFGFGCHFLEKLSPGSGIGFASTALMYIALTEKQHNR